MNISLYKLSEESYRLDTKNKSYRVKGISDEEYKKSFNRTIKPLLQKYKNKNEKYQIPDSDIEVLLIIYNLLENGDNVIRKLSNKKYVEAKSLMSWVNSLKIDNKNKKNILEFFEYDVRVKLDILKEKIINNMYDGLDYISMPYNDIESYTRDPKILKRIDKKKNKEEKMLIEDKLKIIEYITEKHNEFLGNLRYLVNDIAIARSEGDERDIQLLIKRLSYWE